MAHTRRIRNTIHKGGYIYLRTAGGLNDNLVQLAKCTKYAVQHGRSIILEMPTYSATDISTVFDFSHFPVKVYTNYKEMREKLASHPIVPSYYGSLTRPTRRNWNYTNRKWSSTSGKPLEFDFSKSYLPNVVLVYSAGGGGEGDDAVEILSHIRLTPEVKELYREKLKDYSVPAEYVSIHLRATDRKLNITNNITGMLLKDSNAIIKMPSSGNTHADALKKIRAFIKAHPIPVFVSGDNPKLIAKLMDKYPSILAGNDIYGKSHYNGAKDPDNLKNAIADLLILAGAKAIMTSQGGYSRLAKKLRARPEVLKSLLS